MYDRSKEYAGPGRSGGGAGRLDDRRSYGDRGYYRDEAEHRMDPRDAPGRGGAYYDAPPPPRGPYRGGYEGRPPLPQYTGPGRPPKGGPRPWDYTRRPIPRNDEEHYALERERAQWEMRERERWGPYLITQPYPDPPSFRRYGAEPRERGDYPPRDTGYAPPADPYRQYSRRSRSPQDRRADAPYRGDPYRRSPPLDSGYRPASPPRAPPVSTPAGGFISTPPTGPRGTLPGGGDREPSGYFSPSHSRYSRRDAPMPRPSGPSGASKWREYGSNDNSGHATPLDDDSAYRAERQSPRAHAHTSTSSPFTADVTAPHLSAVPQSAPTQRVFSAGHALCPDLDAELLAIEAQRSTFVSTFFFGQPHIDHRNLLFALKDAELEQISATIKVNASEKALDLAKESADAYSLEENRKEELLAQQQRLAV